MHHLIVIFTAHFRMTISTITLNNGVQIPSIGFGTWAGQQQAARSQASTWILTALQAGYRHIDTAAIYGTESVVGEAIRKSGIPRGDIFVTSKLPWNHTKRVEESLDESLKRTGLSYFDLYLIHWPQTIAFEGNNPAPLDADGSLKLDETGNFNDTWKEMEKLLQTGKVKAIGVCNFSIKTLEQLFKTAKVVPAVLQVETHPFIAESDLLAYCRAKGIIVAAYAATGYALGRSDTTITELASEYNVTPTQIIHSWHKQRGTVVITKSENVNRQKENLKTITLSAEDMQRVDTLDRGQRICIKPDKNGKIFGWSYERLGWKEPEAHSRVDASKL
ncbi:Aldo/keto reductase [Gyrodon lividus]|nr:Aldo/keto reductase [Gyrodon lividus]